MSSQSAENLAARSGSVFEFTSSVAYATLALGYLLGILFARQLTVGNFIAFTATQALYCAVLWALVRDVLTRWRAPYMLLFFVLTVVSGILGATGLYWDWLLYLVTVSIYFVGLRIRLALLAAFFLYGAMALNQAFLDDWRLSSGGATSLISFTAAFAFVGAFSLVTTLLRQQKERAEQLLQEVEQSKGDLEEAHAQLRRYAAQVEELTIARERTRIAREMHDTLGHYLTILNVQLEAISKLQERDPARAAAEIAEARHVAAQSMQELRNAIAALRLTGNATKSLVESLGQLGREFQRVVEETELTLDLDAELPPLQPETQVMLYRVAQEALTNVRKHAHASKVLVRLRYEDEWLELLILDNGSGLPASNEAETETPVSSTDSLPPGGFGLIGLRERAELLGGQVNYGPASPSGFRVTVKVRVPSPQAGETQPGLAVAWST